MLKFLNHYSSLASIITEIIIIKSMIYFYKKSKIKIIDNELLWPVALIIKTISSFIFLSFSLLRLFDFIIIWWLLLRSLFKDIAIDLLKESRINDIV